jgi:hypothetical protein
MKKVADEIPGYTYGEAAVAPLPVSLEDLEELKVTVGFTTEDERLLRLAGEVAAHQTKPIVDQWRSRIIASIPNLARHSRTPEGIPSRIISHKATFASNNGSSIPVFDLTAGIGLIISRRSL